VTCSFILDIFSNFSAVGNLDKVEIETTNIFLLMQEYLFEITDQHPLENIQILHDV